MSYSSLFPPLPHLPPQNVHNILFHRPDQASWPDYPLYVDALTGQTLSYKEFLETVRDGATAMNSDVHVGGLGIHPRKDELVGVLSENSTTLITLLHSLLVMTVPFVMFSSYSTPFEFQQHLKLVVPTRLFVSRSLLPLALSSGIRDDRIYIIEGDVGGRTSYEQLVARARKDGIPRLPIQWAEKDTLAYLMFSSGTSGFPKAVMISHGNLVRTVLQNSIALEEVMKVKGPSQNLGLDSREVIFSVLPIHHSAGLLGVAFMNFYVPTTLVLLPKWNVDVFFDCISRQRITFLYLVPSLVHQIVHHPKFQTTDFSTIRTVKCGAAHLPVSLAKKLCSRFHEASVTESYGLTEATLFVATQPKPGLLEGRAKYVPGSLGILAPGIEARIVREDGGLAAVNEPGNLYLRSDTVALGYWKNPEATKETFKDGWLRTGDRVRIDADGVLYFEDRSKDTLKISGMQVSPAEIEDTLLKHPEQLITDACVAGVSGGRTDDERVPRAWVVLSSHGKVLGGPKIASKLDAWIQEKLSRYKWLRGGIGIVEEIPKSPTGKVLRRALVEAHEAALRVGATKL